MGKLFPQYFLLGYALQGLALLSLAFKGFMEKPFPWVRLILLLMMLGCTLYAGIQVQPKAHMLRTVARSMEDGKEKEIKQAEFSRLHKTSVLLNSAVFLMGLVVIGVTAVRLR